MIAYIQISLLFVFFCLYYMYELQRSRVLDEHIQYGRSLQLGRDCLIHFSIVLFFPSFLR
jgi:hypothetical protein